MSLVPTKDDEINELKNSLDWSHKRWVEQQKKIEELEALINEVRKDRNEIRQRLSYQIECNGLVENKLEKAVKLLKNLRGKIDTIPAKDCHVELEDRIDNFLQSIKDTEEL